MLVHLRFASFKSEPILMEYWDHVSKSFWFWSAGVHALIKMFG